MTTASTSAVLTLIALIVAGPLYYGVRHLYSKYSKSKPASNGDDSKTELEMATKSPMVADNDESLIEAALHHHEDTLAHEGEPQSKETQDDHVVSHSSYLLGLLGYAIGIGNIWRFPYLVGQYGGGAFVFAYVVCLFLIAMPLYLVELGLGQYTRMGAIETLNMIRPRWRSLGWAQVMMVTIILSYYNILIAYSCIYLIGSLLNPLPWESKGSEEYWEEDVLNSYSEGGGLGPLQWKIVVSLMVVYFLVFLSVGFGKKFLTDITWITVVGPIMLVVIMFFKTVTLPGAHDGIEFYLGKFEWSELYNGELWAVACGQIIFSLSPGCGTAIALSSVVDPKEDVFKVCITVGLANSCFSLFGGFTIFSILGNLALETDQDVADLASQSGTGLAFISIADGITHFGSGANVMSLLFFLTLICLGLDSTFAWLETLIASAEDICKRYNIKANYTQIVAGLCVMLFIIGLPFCTRGGNNLLDVIDHFVGAWFLLFSCFVESLLFKHDFGWDRFVQVIKNATKGNTATPQGRDLYPSFYWKACVVYLVPVTTIGLLLSEFVHDAFIHMYGDGDYSKGLVGVGWFIFVALLCVSLSTVWDEAPSTLPSDWKEDCHIEEKESSGEEGEPSKLSTDNSEHY